MKQEKRGKDIYLQLEFDDFGGTNWNNGPECLFAYIDGSGNVTKEKGKDGVRFWVTWQEPHGPEEKRTLKTGGSVYLELPEAVCAEVDRYRKESHEKNAEMRFFRHRDRFEKTCRGMTDAEITIQEEKELALVNFLLEPDKHPEPAGHRFRNARMPKIVPVQFAALFEYGREYFWKRYRHKAECDGNRPPGNNHENDILLAEGFIRYRDYLKKRLSEPGTTDSMTGMQMDLTEEEKELQVNAKKEAAISNFEETCKNYFFLPADATRFCKLLRTYFIDGITPSIETTFQLRASNNAKIAREVKEVFQACGGGNLKKQKGLFQIMRSLSAFSNKEDVKIYNDLKGH
jgi:hypothetical protein